MGKKTTKVWFTLVTALLVVVLFAGVTSVSASAVTTTQSLVKTETFTTNDGKFIVWNPLTGTIQYFDNGKYIGNYTGLQTLLDGQTWYIHDGRIDPSFSGIVKYDGARWYVSNGTVNKNKNGFVDSNGETYLVEKGKVSSKSGSYSANKGTYTLSSGRVTGVRFNVPAVNQKPKYPTGCEGAAATSLLRFYGYNVSLDEMIRAIPRENITVKNGRRYGPSIYEKFVGDPRGGYTSRNPGYGAFAPVVTKAMNNVIRNHGGSRTATNITGSSVNTLYQNLALLPAKKVTVVTDACFSGAFNSGNLLKNASPLAIAPKTGGYEKLNIFSSSKGTEISSWYTDKKHGLFTYFFLKGLQGEADADGNKTITAEELEEYLEENVPALATRLYNRAQNPVFSGRKNDKKKHLDQ